MKGLILLAVIYQMHAVLNTKLRWKTKSRHLLLLVKENRKFKKSLNGKKKRYTWFKQGPTDRQWRNMLCRDSVNSGWKKNYWMSRKIFHELVGDLIPCISPDILSPNRRMTPAKKKLAKTLHFLKDTRSLIMTANVFWYSFIYCIENYLWSL